RVMVSRRGVLDRHVMPGQHVVFGRHLVLDRHLVPGRHVMIGRHFAVGGGHRLRLAGRHSMLGCRMQRVQCKLLAHHRREEHEHHRRQAKPGGQSLAGAGEMHVVLGAMDRCHPASRRDEPWNNRSFTTERVTYQPLEAADAVRIRILRIKS
ncbi:MAG: hypothetical protein JSV72_17610, partial [Ralstonia sp.]